MPRSPYGFASYTRLNGVSVARRNRVNPPSVTTFRMRAFFKMSLVVLIFMNVKADSPLTKLFVGAGFFWMAILLALTLGDYFSRGWMPGGKFW